MLATALNSFANNSFANRPDHCGSSNGLSNGFCNRAAYTVTAYSYSSSSVNASGVSLSARIESDRFDGFGVFERLLQKGYENLQGNAGLPLAQSEDRNSRAEKTAATILGAIEQRLHSDSDQGATPEQLASRLEAGQQGFEKGFGQAREELEKLGLLSDAVAEDIGHTYNRVQAGIENLRETYVSQPSAQPLAADVPVQANENSSELEQAPVRDSASADNTQVSSRIRGAEQYSYAARNTFSFELETSDGDKVTIRASARELFAASQTFKGFQDSTATGFAADYAAHYSHSNSFSLEVSGELDDEELTAINELLGQVNRLSSQFFAGDVQGAFEQAFSLGYDDSEIASFALNLTHAQVERVASAYQAFAPTTPSLVDRLAPMGQFTRELLAAMESASPFAQPKRLIGDLARGVAEAAGQPGQPIENFVSRLLQSLPHRAG